MIADEFPDTALEAHFAVRTKSVTFEERLSQVEQARLPQPVVAIPELIPSPIRRQLQSASQNSPSIESLRTLAATLSDFLSQADQMSSTFSQPSNQTQPPERSRDIMRRYPKRQRDIVKEQLK
jgi:hypothetical protein